MTWFAIFSVFIGVIALVISAVLVKLYPLIFVFLKTPGQTGKILVTAWKLLGRTPFDRWLFSQIIAFNSPYSGTVGGYVESIDIGSAKVSIKESRGLRNPFRSIHAAALVNVGEMASGMALLYSLAVTPETAKRIAIPTKIEISFLKKAKGKIRATATVDVEVMKGDKNSQDGYAVPVVVDLSDSKGQVVSTMTVHWTVSSPKAKSN
jgi:acyl-coenzyme A thioesterase PaaI-like protein